MAERFRNAARKVSTLSSSVNVWQSDQTTNSLSVASSTRRKSFIDSFKTAVDKVKLKKKVAAFLESEYDPMVFRTVFNLPEDKARRVTIFQENQGNDEDDETDLRNLEYMTNAEVADFVSQKLVGKVLDSKCFRFTILFLILVNSILIAVETNKDVEREYGQIFKIMDQVIMTVFICEILLKWYHGFRKFWKQGWNILDFFIVVSLIIGPLVMNSGGRGVLRILRVLRAFRSLRSISSLPGLQVVVQTIMQSVPDMTNIVLLLVIIMLVFSVIGITLFRDVMPHQFGDLSTAMFSLFICVTQDGWMEIFEAFQEQGETYYYGGGLYLILFISIGAFIFANLVVAVVVTNLECAVKDVKEEEQLQAKILAIKGRLPEENQSDDADLVIDADIPNRVFQEQNPLITPNLNGMDIRSIEHFFLVIEAMEENLRTYQQLKNDLIKIHDEICLLSKSAIAEGVIMYDDDIVKKSTKEKETAYMSYQKAVASGDIVSNLMNMENASLIDSRSKSNLHEIVIDTANLQTRLGSFSSRIGAKRRSSMVAPNIKGRSQAVKNVQRRASLGL